MAFQIIHQNRELRQQLKVDGTGNLTGAAMNDERAVKKQAKAKGKVKRGRKPKNAVPDVKAIGVIGDRSQKRKIAAPEADMSEPKSKVVRMSEGSLPKKTSISRTSEAQVLEYEIMQF